MGSPQFAKQTWFYSLGEFNIDVFLSLLFMGYIAIDSQQSAGVKLAIPNSMMNDMFIQYLQEALLKPALGVRIEDRLNASDELANKTAMIYSSNWR
jgi:hypothetical protein